LLQSHLAEKRPLKAVHETQAFDTGPFTKHHTPRLPPKRLSGT
jgi:hypothetical protein